MFDVLSDLNWLGIAVSTVFMAILGGVYFGALVPALYLRSLGRGAGSDVPSSALRAAGPLVCAFVAILTSAVLIAALAITDVSDALVFGVVVGLGYLGSMTFQIALNPNFPHPLAYGALNLPYFVIGSLVTSTVLVAV